MNSENQKNGCCGHSSKKNVPVFINCNEHRLESGKYTGAELKKFWAVPGDHDLDKVIDGKFIPINDDTIVDIECCEKFFSHPKCGRSS